MKVDVKQRTGVAHGTRGKSNADQRPGHGHRSDSIPGHSRIDSRSGWMPADTAFRRTCLSAMLATCFDMAVANPTAPQVVAGQASFATQGNTLSVTNTPNTIINWNSFSINPGELTRFIQQNANSSVLNRITGQNPSQILGALQSNGKVFLINPNGILFGAGSRVDVNGLVASSLNLSNQDFLSGKLNFTHAAISGNVSNKGAITTPGGGQVFLIAPNVENSGIITSPNGQVMLAAGHSVQLVDSGNPDLHVVVSSPQDQAINLGQIVSEAGKVGIYGALVKQRGVVNANSAVIGENGKVVFKASRDALLEAGSVTSARGAGTGGAIHVLGERVGLVGDAQIDVSGSKGGGTVLLGGDFQGKNAAVPNARFAYVSPQASVRADALQQGDGGTVIVWSEEGTQVYGKLDAQGGVQAGNGGLIETSGKLRLDVDGALVRAAARSAREADKNGQWLLDPTDVTVVHGSSGSLTAGMFDPPSNSMIGDTQINTALAAGTDVTIQTSGGTGGTGKITLSGTGDAGGAVSITNRGGGTRSVNLSASGAIEVRTGATLSGQSGDALNVAMTAGSGITFNGEIDSFGGNTVLTGATSFGGKIKNTLLSASNTITGNSGFLDNITVMGTVNLAGSTFVSNDLTLATGGVLNLDNSNLYFYTNGIQHLAGNGTINLAGANLSAGYVAAGQTLVIDNGVTVQGHGGIYNTYPALVQNNGAIIGNTSAHSLVLQPASFTNTGSLTASAGTLSVGQLTWSNSGTISVAPGATLNLGMDTTTAGLGTITRSGGSVNYNGVLDNNSAVLDIGAGGPFGSGGLTQFGGTIRYGAIKSSDSTVLDSSSGVLDSVLVLGTLGLSGSLFVQNDLTLANGATLNMGTSGLYFKGNGTRHLNSGGNSTVNMAGSFIYAGYAVTGQTLEIGTGITLQGHGGIYESSPSTLINSGTIDANSSGQNFSLGGTTFFNNGALKASSGSLLLAPTNWNNNGSMAVAGTGALKLNVNTTTAGLGSVSRSGGSVYFDGVLDNTGAVLDIGGGGIFGSGGLSGLAGTIKNGTVASGDATVLSGSSATLNAVTISGELSASGNFFVKNDLTLANGAQLNLGTGNLYFSQSGHQHIASAGASSIKLAGGALYAGYGVSGQTLHVDAGITLQGHGGLYDSLPATVQNLGTIKASSTGQTFSIQSGTFNNAGSLQAVGGNLTIGDIGWSNTGSMHVGVDGLLTLGFDTTTAGLGNITRSGGSVNYNGVLDNTGNTLDIGGGGIFGAGGLGGLGGTIKQGTLFSSDTTHLKMSNGTLDNVTISGNLSTTGNAFIKNGVTLASGASVNLGTSAWYFTGSGTSNIASAGNATFNLAGATLYAGYGATGQTLSIGSAVTLAGYGGLYHSSTATVANAGVIDANVSGQIFTVAPATLTNTGTLRASSGTLTLDPTTWNNTGSMQAAGAGVLNLNFDTSTANLGSVTRSGGTVNFNGVLDNSGATLDIGAAGPFGSGGLTHFGGTIKNGQISSGDSTALTMSSGATLDGVTVAGNMTMSGLAFIKNGVTLANDAVLDLGNGSWYFNSTGTQHIATPGTASILLSGGAVYGGYGVSGQTLQIDSGITLRGYGHLLQSSPTTLANHGVITADSDNQTLWLQFASITNTGSLRADANGSKLALSGLAANSGVIDVAGGAIVASSDASLINKAGAVLAGSGTISVASGGTITNQGSILPGGVNSVGTLHLVGNFVQAAGGNLLLDAGPDAATHDVLAITGSATLDGALTTNALGNYAPANGEQFDFINYTGLASGSFATVDASGFTGATPDYSGTGVFLLRMPNGTVINIWLFDGSGNWSDPTKWSLGHVPTASEDVQVPDYTSQFSLNIAANANVAKSVVFVGNDKLAISGGSLNVGGTLNLNSGSIELSGNGVLSASASMRASVFSVADSAMVNLASGSKLQALDFNMSGGTIAGAANMEIFHGFNRTGGSLGTNLSGIDVIHASGTLSPGSMDIAGPIKLSASAGDISVGHNLVAGSGSISLNAVHGAIKNTGGVITAPVLALQARDGIGDAAPLDTVVATLQASNSQSGAIAINNAGSGLNLADLGTLGYGVRQQGSGNIAINNSGAHALSIGAPVVVAGGNVALKADSIAFANSNNAKIDGSAGGVLLRATGTGGANGIVMPVSSSITTNGGGATNSFVSLVADSFTLAGSINAGLSSGTVRIEPNTVGMPIGIVSAVSNATGKLELVGSELQAIQAANLIIGDDSASTGSGALSLHAPLHTHAAVNTLVLQTGCNGGTACASINQDSNGMISANNLVLNAAQGVNLNAATNDVAHLAASIGNNGNNGNNGSGLVFANGKSLKIGVGSNGITAINQAVEVNVTAGSLNLSESVTAGTVNLGASGSIGSSNGKVYANAVALSSGDGIHLTTYTGTLLATNSGGSAGINLTNYGNLLLNTVQQQGSGGVHVENYGPMTVAGPVSSGTGAILLETHSPLTIDGSVTSSGGGSITLRAGNSNSNTDTLTINSGAVVTSSGSVSLVAGSTITVAQGSTVSAQAKQLPMQNSALPSLNSCISNPALPRCNEVLPTLATCTGAPATPGCIVVLPSIATCTSAPATAGCSAVLPTLDTCTTDPTTPGCSVVLPSLVSCISAPATPGCSAVLPSLASCTSAPATPGCSAVLPSLATCTTAPATPGCSVVLPTLANCTATPTLPGCSAVLPNLATCTTAPATPGCSVVLPALSACVSAPATPGCSAVLPTLSACVSAPATPGCSVVLPNIASCTSTPELPGCSVVLPTLATCVSAPATPGCSVVLPNILTCTVNPSAPGCSAVLPSLASCITAPATAGCSAVLPSLANCTATPGLPGCSVVLPNLAACILAPATPGCSAVLPSIATCISNPHAEGCTAVLPNLAACISNPQAAGCSAVLPNLASCISHPQAEGCSVVLPNLASCISHPQAEGCSVVLPNLASCISHPQAEGCSVVLPNLASCISHPQAEGCSVVLPNLASCVSNPQADGCGVVLPNLASCISNPQAAGCSAVLPNLATCISAPTATGCSVVLPSLAACSATPSLPGCSVVLPDIGDCLVNPAGSGCQVVVTPGGNGNTGELNQVLNNTVDIVTNTIPVAQPVTQVGLPPPAAADKPPAATTPASTDKPLDGTSPAAKPGESKEEAKKDEKKDDSVNLAAKPEAKKEEPVRKLYCN